MFIEFNTMFKKHQTATMVILGIFISIPFIFYTGSGSSIFDSSRERVIGEVNEEEIKSSEYLELFRSAAMGDFMHKGSFFDNPNDDRAQEATLKRKALLDELVTEKQINAVTNAEIKAYIDGNKFLDNKTLDRVTLISRARNFYGLSGSEFDNIVKENIVIQKYEDSLKKNITATDEEATERYNNENLKFDVLYKQYTSKDFTDKIAKAEFEANKAKYTEKDFAKARPAILENLYGTQAEKYYNDNLKKYELATRVESTVIIANPLTYEKDIKIEDKAVQAQYDADATKYKNLDQIKTLTITVPNKDEAQAAKTIVALNAALELLVKGDKATLKKFNANKRPSTWEDKKNLAPALLKAATAKKPQFILHEKEIVYIQQLEERKEIPFAEVKDQIKTDLLKASANEKMAADLKKFSTDIAQFAGTANFKENLDKIIEGYDFTTQALDAHFPRSAGSNLNRLGLRLAYPTNGDWNSYMQQTNAIGALSQAKPVTSFFKSQDGRVFMLALNKEIPPYQQTLAEVRSQVLGEIHTEKAQADARKEADTDFESLKAAKADALTKAKFAATGLKPQAQLGFGLNAYVNHESKAEELYTQSTADGQILYFVVKVEKPSADDLKKNLASTKEKIIGERSQEALNDFYTALYKKSVRVTGEKQAEAPQK